jgi:hypothetical protein
MTPLATLAFMKMNALVTDLFSLQSEGSISQLVGIDIELGVRSTSKNRVKPRFHRALMS